MTTIEQRALIFLALVTFCFFALGTGQSLAALFDASGLLGQSDYFTHTLWPISDHSFRLPAYSALDSGNHRLFVSDQYNARVLVFDLQPDNSIAAPNASFILGQASFTDSVSTTTQNGMSVGVHGLAYDSENDRLFVADQGNDRVLVFDVNPATITNGENAINVLGQPDFVSGPDFGLATTSAPRADNLAEVSGLAYDQIGRRLFVAEGGDHDRVLVFDVNPATITNGENAINVLGQPDFVTTVFGIGQNTTSHPAGVAFDGNNQRLFVPEINANRVLVFDVNPATITNGENAINVLGQPDFVSGGGYQAGTTSQNSLFTPRGTAHDPLRNLLYVADSDNHRVLVFDVNPATITNGENAINVLGQPDFTSNGVATTQNGFSNTLRGPSLDWVNNILYVVDARNQRVLGFSLIKIITASLPSGVVDSPYSQMIHTANNQGVVSFQLVNGLLPDGLSLDTETGSISGRPGRSGTFTFTVRANDSYSVGLFFDQATYTIVIPDTVSPTVSIESPSVGSVITRTTTFLASANDNDMLSSISFQLDGINIGDSSPNSPYSLAWDSATVPNGPHILSASATDMAGNLSTAEVVFTVKNIRVYGNGSGPANKKLIPTTVESGG